MENINQESSHANHAQEIVKYSRDVSNSMALLATSFENFFISSGLILSKEERLLKLVSETSQFQSNVLYESLKPKDTYVPGEFDGDLWYRVHKKTKVFYGALRKEFGENVWIKANDPKVTQALKACEISNLENGLNGLIQKGIVEVEYKKGHTYIISELKLMK